MTRALIPNTDSNKNTIKFLYSYGGKILPRPTDAKLRYAGGMTRVLSVPRSVTFAELMVKFGELCGSSMTLKCKLPNEDLDVLISIKNDEDLKNLIDEYDRFATVTLKDEKITAVLFPIKDKKITPVSSAEDLCSSGSNAQSANAMYHRERAKMYRQKITPVSSAEDLCSPGLNAQSANAMYHRERAKMYRHKYIQRCRGGYSPRHECFVPCGNYGR